MPRKLAGSEKEMTKQISRKASDNGSSIKDDLKEQINRNKSLIYGSSKFIDDVEKAIAILKTRGKENEAKTIHVSDHITIYYMDTDSEYMIEEELDF